MPMTETEKIRTWIAYLGDEDCGLIGIAHLVAAGESAIEPVIQAYLRPVNVTMSHNARRILVSMGPITVAPLLDLLARKQMEFSVARILGSIRDPRVIEPLINLLTHKNPPVRWAAAGSLKEQKATPAIEPLILRLRDRSSRIRSVAVEALSEFGDERALHPLRHLLRDRYPEIRSAAAKAIEQITARASATKSTPLA